MIRAARLLLCCAPLLAVGQAACSEDVAPQPTAEEEIIPGASEGLACDFVSGEVSRVRDGDTIDLQHACGTDRDCPRDSRCVEGLCDPDVGVRLMAINAGEISHSANQEAECMADDAALAARRLLVGHNAHLVYEPVAGCNEVYGRELAYVWVDGVLVQERLLELGLTCIYWYDNKREQEQTIYYQRLVAAQERAQRLELGIWSPEGAACRGLAFPERCL